MTENFPIQAIVRDTLLHLTPVLVTSVRHARTDQKHTCSNYSLQIVKRATDTFTGEEALEFKAFQKNRSKFCTPVQRLVRPNLGNTNLAASKRKAKFTEPKVPRKRKHYGKRPQPPQKIPFLMSLQLNPQDIPKSLPPPTVESPIITISHAEPVSSAPIIATSNSETTPTPTIRNSPRKPINPSITLKSDLALSSSSSSSSSESVKSKPDLVYEKTTVISHPKAKDQISIMTDGIIDKVHEYSIPEINTTIQNYEPTNKMDLKVKDKAKLLC